MDDTENNQTSDARAKIEPRRNRYALGQRDGFLSLLTRARSALRNALVAILTFKRVEISPRHAIRHDTLAAPARGPSTATSPT